MTDSEARRLERAWRQDPSDVGAARRAQDALARAGLCLPRDLGAAARHEARLVESPARLAVWATTADGVELDLGRTPGPVAVPASRRWGVTAGLDGGATIADGIDAARALGAPGLRLAGEVSPALPGLAALPALEALELVHGQPAPTGWAAISALDALERLEVRREAPDGAGAEALERLPRLRHLALGTPQPAQVALLLSRLPRLEELHVAAADPGLDQLARLRGAARLSGLTIHSSGPDLEAALGRLPALRALTLHARRLDDDACEALARAGRALERLIIFGCGGLTARGLSALATLPALRELALHGLPARVGAGCLDGLSAAPLRRLALGSSGPSVDGLVAGLLPHPTLEELDLVGDDELSAEGLFASPALRRVRLAGGVAGRGLETLAGSPLESLEVTSSRLQANDLERFVQAAPPGLRRLVLTASSWSRPISLRDIGAPSLARLEALRELGFVGHRELGARGLARLLAGLPALERLRLDRLAPGAALGVAGHPALEELRLDAFPATDLVGLARSLPRLRLLHVEQGDVTTSAAALPGVWVEQPLGRRW